MPRAIAAALWIIASGCCLGVTTGGLEERRPYEAVAGVTLLMMLAAIWLARAAWKHSVRYQDLAEWRDVQARALAAREQELEQQNCALVRTVDWFCNGVGTTVPMHIGRITRPLRRVR